MRAKWESTAGPTFVQIRDWKMEVYRDKVVVSRDREEGQAIGSKNLGRTVLGQCLGCGGRYYKDELTRSNKDGVFVCGPCLSVEGTE